jgi:hypothetical protein
MTTGSSRVAHGSCHAVGLRCRSELGHARAGRSHMGRAGLEQSIEYIEASGLSSAV